MLCEAFPERNTGNESVQRLINKTPYFPNCQSEPKGVTYLEFETLLAITNYLSTA